MNNTDIEYLRVLRKLHTLNKKGTNRKGDRTGTGTTSYFGDMVSFKFDEGFPILTTKSIWFSGVKTELLWFLGNHLKDPKYSKFERTNIRYLLDNKNRIWSEWPFVQYLRANHKIIPEVNSDQWNIEISQWENRIRTDDDFCQLWGNLGPVYGAQWMEWGTHIPHRKYINSNRGDYGYSLLAGKTYINQLSNCIDLLKNNPDSRRIMVNAWNPSEVDDMALPPCHYGFQFYTHKLSIDERMHYWFVNSKPNRDVCDHVDELEYDEKWEELTKRDVPERYISLMWNQRSVDTFLGLPFNISSYALLLSLVSKEVNMLPYELKGSLGDVHLYSNHIDQADEHLSRINNYKLPNLEITEGKSMFDLTPDDIKLVGYEKESSIKAPIAV